LTVFRLVTPISAQEGGLGQESSGLGLLATYSTTIHIDYFPNAECIKTSSLLVLHLMSSGEEFSAVHSRTLTFASAVRRGE